MEQKQTNALYQSFEEIAESPLYFAAYADPPGHTETDDGSKIITMPDGWHSTMQDRVKGHQIIELGGRRKYGEIIDSAWDAKGGLIVLGKTKMKHVIDCQLTKMVLQFTSICASIEYYPKHSKTNRDIIYCEDTKIDHFVRVEDGGGCNSTGGIMFPTAKEFTKNMLEFRRKSMYDSYSRTGYLEFLHRPALSHAYVKRLFPTYDFGANKILEQFAYATNTHGQMLSRNTVPKDELALRLVKSLGLGKKRDTEDLVWALSVYKKEPEALERYLKSKMDEVATYSNAEE